MEISTIYDKIPLQRNCSLNAPVSLLQGTVAWQWNASPRGQTIRLSFPHHRPRYEWGYLNAMGNVIPTCLTRQKETRDESLRETLKQSVLVSPKHTAYAVRRKGAF